MRGAVRLKRRGEEDDQKRGESNVRSACNLDLSYTSWVTQVSVPINVIIIREGVGKRCESERWKEGGDEMRFGLESGTQGLVRSLV